MCQRCNDAAAHNFFQCTVADMWEQPLALSITDLFTPARSAGDRPTRGSQSGPLGGQIRNNTVKIPSRKLHRILFLAMLS